MKFLADTLWDLETKNYNLLNSQKKLIELRTGFCVLNCLLKEWKLMK